MPEIDYAPQAREDLLVASFDLLDRSGDPAVAERFTKILGRKLELLASHKLAGGACPEYGIAHMRQFPVREYSYVIFYRPASDGIEVLRIVHGSRDMQKIRFDNH